MQRIDWSLANPRDMVSRSAVLNANRDLLRTAGLMPPVAAITLLTDDDGLSNKRPIELIVSPRRHRFQISALCVAE